jgi:hypothetical protein
MALRDSAGDRIWIESRHDAVTLDDTEVHIDDGACTGMLRVPCGRRARSRPAEADRPERRTGPAEVTLDAA